MWGRGLRDTIAQSARTVDKAAAGTRDAADRIADAVEEAVRILAAVAAVALALLAVKVLTDE